MTAQADSDPLEPAGDPAARREIVTPEGVPLAIDLAGRGGRAVALLVDLVIMWIAIGLICLVLLLLFSRYASFEVGVGVGLLVWFLIRSFYFIFFELRWQGATPGKRLLGLRVIDRSGGPLRADAIFARNLMREVELFLPLTLLIGAAGQAGSDAWVTLLTLVWTGILVLLPVLNKDRLRAGDIIGGTWVVAAPKTVLLPDAAVTAAASSLPEAQECESAFVFTEAQLQAYGIFELQTLERVLRSKGGSADRAREAVSQQIRQKIGWEEGAATHDARRFLEAYYAALRGHLEKKMLFGVRRENKHDSE